MKTFKQYLLEADDPVPFDEFILKNCKNFMLEAGADIEAIRDNRMSLYRGVKGLSNRFDILDPKDGLVDGYIKTVRDERRLLDTPGAITELIDDVFEKKFGWRPRTQGFFCFPYRLRGFAEDYGMKCKVYPMGEMQYVYSTTVKDMTYSLSQWVDAQGMDWIKKHDNIPPDKLETYKFAVESFIEKHNYRNDSLETAMSDGKPGIMIRCKQYLAIPASIHA